MLIRHHPLISATLGTARQITSFHYGPAGGQKVYIQSSLHADELPGMLVVWKLRARLDALEREKCLRGEIVLVPVPNPAGLNQRLLGQALGRYEAASAENFNRNFTDPVPLALPLIKGRLNDAAAHNVAVIRGAIAQVLGDIRPTTELASQRLALQRLSCDADVVLDLHCDLEAVMHVYTNPDTWPDIEPLARYLDAHTCLLALNSVGNPFDEIHSFGWSELRRQFGDLYPIPYGAVSTTVECRGQRDVSHAFAEHDAGAIVHYLTRRGVIDGVAPEMPPLRHPPTPLAGSAPLIAPVTGIVVFHAEPGDWITAGQTVAEIIDPLTDEVTAVASEATGVLYARARTRFATAGAIVANVAGAQPFRTGALLSD
jgi:predicted deacylase